jgi:hypothetical protein
LPTGSQSQPGGDVGFSQARVTHQENRLGLLDVDAASQVEHLQYVGCVQTRNAPYGLRLLQTTLNPKNLSRLS